MLKYIGARLSIGVLSLLVVSMVTFSMAFLAGDPAVAIAGRNASASEITNIRELYGFDRPVVVQYGNWLAKTVTGDLGFSYRYRQPVADMIAKRLPVTMTLCIASLLLALLLAVPLAIVSAVRSDGIIARISNFLCVLGQSTPPFWFALVLIVIFGLNLRVLPISGAGTWLHFVMPTFVLAFFAMPPILRLTQTAMKNALSADYIRTARSKGLPAKTVLIRHALRNVLVPLVSVTAFQLGTMLGGSIVVEQIFALPGLGALGFDATLRSDLPLLQAITILIAAVYILLMLCADCINAAVDPRLKQSIS